MKRADQAEVLKQHFDKVVLKHYTTGLYKGTKAALVKGNQVFLGTSLCVQEDQFNRRVGRLIALGRALHAYQVSTGQTHGRKSLKHTQVLVATSPENIEEILTAQIFNGLTPVI